jgi:hypothetical protein
MRATGAIMLVSLLVLGVGASAAYAEPLAMEFTEARANVGVQLDDAALFEAPATAPFAAQFDPGSGSITTGALSVPQFSTFITDPVDANVTVDFEIGAITGSFDEATGALTGSGTAGGTLTADGKHCTVSTVPAVLELSTGGNSGGTSPRSGVPFANGLTGAGAVAGQWTDMIATPVTEEDEAVCETVDEHISGPGGIWLDHEGDVVPPVAPWIGTDPASPSTNGTPRIRGAAESGSTVKVYAGPGCAGTLVATASAAQLSSPGIPVSVAEGATAVFSATVTDAAGNASACSAAISYKRLKKEPPPAPAPTCVVPKLKGKTLAQAKRALKRADCKLGEVTKPKKRPKGKNWRPLVVKSSSPRQGATPADGKVDLKLRVKPKPKKLHR